MSRIPPRNTRKCKREDCDECALKLNDCVCTISNPIDSCVNDDYDKLAKPKPGEVVMITIDQLNCNVHQNNATNSSRKVTREIDKPNGCYHDIYIKMCPPDNQAEVLTLEKATSTENPQTEITANIEKGPAKNTIDYISRTLNKLPFNIDNPDMLMSLPGSSGSLKLNDGVHAITRQQAKKQADPTNKSIKNPSTENDSDKVSPQPSNSPAITTSSDNLISSPPELYEGNKLTKNDHLYHDKCTIATNGPQMCDVSTEYETQNLNESETAKENVFQPALNPNWIESWTKDEIRKMQNEDHRLGDII